MYSRSLHSSVLALMLAISISACGPQVDLTNAGFASNAALQNADRIVLAESVGGRLDPAKLAPSEGRFTHDNVQYSATEEGYYRWGQELYKLGYRDVVYVEDLAPKAFRRQVMSIYADALSQGFRNAEKELQGK